MKRGYASTIRLVKEDLAFEEEILGRILSLSEKVGNGSAQEALNKLEGRSRKNIDKLTQILGDLEREDYEVKLVCYVCNWWISFGTDPKDGDEGFCEECKLWFRLREVDGNFTVEKIGPRR